MPIGAPISFASRRGLANENLLREVTTTIVTLRRVIITR